MTRRRATSPTFVTFQTIRALDDATGGAPPIAKIFCADILTAKGISMIERETAEPVIQYLRALTYDGELSSAEVWELANWLNQQPEKILQSWPAKPLVAALRNAFEDNQLTHAELEEVAHTIVAIEQLWTESFPPTAEDAAAQELSAAAAIVEETKPSAPAIPITAEFRDELRGDNFTVDLQHHTCTCPEWIENRQAFPEGDYRRLCAHLARAFQSVAREKEELRRDPLFIAFVEEHGRRNKGPEPDNVWRSVVLNGARVLYGASPASEWVNIFAPSDGDGSYKRFGYNRKKKRWSYGERPKEVAWQIASIFSQTQPQIARETVAG
jgi:hypothetical protein